MNKHLTYEEWFNEYENYEDAYIEYVKSQKEMDRLSLLAHDKQQELDQYKNNWEELKTYLNMVIGMNFNMNNDQLSEQKVDDYTNILNKMKELEENN